MPYSSIDELPKEVQDKYSTNAQHAFLKAFDSAMASGKDESAAFAIAHAAAAHAGDKKNEKLLGSPTSTALLIPFPDNPQLQGLQAGLDPIITPLPQESLHLTLLYLPEGGMPEYVLYPQRDFTLYIERLELFPEGVDGFPVVARVGLCPQLAALQAALYAETLSKYDLAVSDYSPPELWQPHITLGYTPEPLELENEWLNVELPVTHFVLANQDRVLADYSLSPLPADVGIKSQSLAEKLWEAFKSLFAPPEEEVPFGSEYATFKLRADSNLWEAWYSNAYQDKEKEFVAEAALTEDIDRMNAENALPELWFFHTPGTRLGKAKAVAKIGRFAVAVGEFDQTPFAQAMKRVFARGDVEWGMSPGFLYKPSYFKKKVYHQIKTFEISVLPKERAANGLTYFALKEGTRMGNKTQDQAHIEKARALLKEKLAGTDIDVDALIAKGLSASDEADTSLEHKMDGMMGETAPDLMGKMADAMQKMADGITMMNQKMDAVLQKEVSETPEPPAPAESEPAPAEPTPMEKQLKAMEEKLQSLEAAQQERAKTMQGYVFEDILQDLAGKNKGQVNGSGDPVVDKALNAMGWGAQEGGKS